jgi:hypothetical protein
MSSREWESGTIKLPSAAWAPFKQALQKGMSAEIAKDYEQAVKLHAALAEQKKGKRGFDLGKAFQDEAYAIIQGRNSYYSSTPDKPKYPFGAVDTWDVERLLLGKEKPYTLRAPKKKDFAPFTSASLSFQGRSCTVTLNNATREVTWEVEEGNHNVEEARGTPLGQLLFALLKKVAWTRATGGTIIGNDENNQDNSDYEGGGGNYVNERFGPLGEPMQIIYGIPKRSKKATTARR